VEVSAAIQRSETDMMNLMEKQLKEQFSLFDEKFGKSIEDIEERLQTVTNTQVEIKNELEVIREPEEVSKHKHNYPEDLEALREELLSKIEEIERKIANTKMEEIIDLNVETENIANEVREKLKKGEEISGLTGDLKDDTAIELYARYLALSKRLDAYKQLVVNGYKDAQKEIELNNKCITYNERITALEEFTQILDNERTEMKKIDVRENMSVVHTKEIIEKTREVKVESGEIVRMEELRQRKNSNTIIPLLLDEKNIAEISSDLGLKVDYLIKGFNDFSLSKADKSVLEEFKNKINEELKELNKEIKIINDTIEASSVARMELEVDYNKTKKTLIDIEVKVIHLLSHSSKSMKYS